MFFCISTKRQVLMTTLSKIIEYDGTMLVLEPTTLIDRELLQKQVGYVEVRLKDGREISAEQRNKIFAIIRDISLWCGHCPEDLRQYMTWDFICQNECEWFSLSDVDMTTARLFITYLIEFCLIWGVPTKKPLMSHAEDVGRYLYHCLEHQKCCICGDRSEVHHVDRIGMGRNRNEICHVGMLVMALCRKHHDEAHLDPGFEQKHHVFGIKLDEFLVKKLKLGRGT